VGSTQNKRRRDYSDPVGRCPTCGKARFFTKLAARRFARRVLPGESLNVYECEGFWHLGHLPRTVRNGYTSRGELYRPDGPAA
jgi:hypothetical protein